MIERPPILITWHVGSMRTTGVSVAAITSLSSRLSRIRNDRTWCRRSTGRSWRRSIIRFPLPPRSGGDDRAHRLAVERTGEGAGFEPVDHLDRTPVLRVLHQLQDAALDD